MPPLPEWLILLVCLFVLSVFILTHIYSFFACHSPVAAEILVIDGWVADELLEAAVAEYRQGAYRTIVTLGYPLTHGRHLLTYRTYADFAAATLIALGVPADMIVPIPLAVVDRERTYTSVLAFNQWLSTEAPDVTSINLFTSGPHARRSRLLYRRVLSPQIQVGVIAGQPIDYAPNRWWNYSSGVRSIISEVIAYLYTLIHLHPINAPRSVMNYPNLANRPVDTIDRC